jgi:hypothetical protein
MQLTFLDTPPFIESAKFKVEYLGGGFEVIPIGAITHLGSYHQTGGDHVDEDICYLSWALRGKGGGGASVPVSESCAWQVLQLLPRLYNKSLDIHIERWKRAKSCE